MPRRLLHSTRHLQPQPRFIFSPTPPRRYRKLLLSNLLRLRIKLAATYFLEPKPPFVKTLTWAHVHAPSHTHSPLEWIMMKIFGVTCDLKIHKIGTKEFVQDYLYHRCRRDINRVSCHAERPEVTQHCSAAAVPCNKISNKLDTEKCSLKCYM